jgi:hypothetical protein
MFAVVVTIVYVLFSVFEIISLSKEKRKKELIVFTVIMSCAFILSMLLIFGVKLPSFDRFIGNIVTSITKE